MLKRWSGLEKIDTLVVDKTGTLTEGKPKVVAIVPADGFVEADILRLAASVERASEHPLADATFGPPGTPSRFGRRGRISTRRPARRDRQGRCKPFFLGNSTFLTSLGVETQSLNEQGDVCAATCDRDQHRGRRKAGGLFAIADPVKPSTPDALKALAADGIKSSC